MERQAIDVANVPHFDQEADVVIVGLGAAGVSAAIEAARAGASVIVLERASAGGGATALSGGFIYLGGGTRIQKEAGFEDSAEDLYTYLRANSPEADEEKIRLYADQSVDHFNWIESNAIPFDGGFYAQKHFEHDSAETLAWTGNEDVWPFREQARAVPRGHKFPGKPEKHVGVGETGGGGQVLMESLIATAEKLGVTILCDVNARALVIDPAQDGRVVGVHFTQFGKDQHVRAARGVVLSTGTFVMNEEMLRQHTPLLADDRNPTLGTTYNDGAGQQMGASAGGALENMGGMYISSPFYPPESLLKGILVNKAGKRFVAEDSYHSRSSIEVLKQPDQTAWLICDNATFGRSQMPHELVDAWESVAEMEADLGIPEGALQETLANYNAAAQKGEDPEYRKSPKWIAPLVEAPFAAIDCTIGTTPYMGFTLGGLRTNANAQVLREDGGIVPGLYAAGQCASNIARDPEGYASGTCIGEGTFFGRRAGKHAAGAL